MIGFFGMLTVLSPANLVIVILIVLGGVVGLVVVLINGGMFRVMIGMFVAEVYGEVVKFVTPNSGTEALAEEGEMYMVFVTLRMKRLKRHWAVRIQICTPNVTA